MSPDLLLPIPRGARKHRAPLRVSLALAEGLDVGEVVTPCELVAPCIVVAGLDIHVGDDQVHGAAQLLLTRRRRDGAPEVAFAGLVGEATAVGNARLGQGGGDDSCDAIVVALHSTSSNPHYRVEVQAAWIHGALRAVRVVADPFTNMRADGRRRDAKVSGDGCGLLQGGEADARHRHAPQ